METKDGKFLRMNISGRQALGIGALLALTAVVVYFDAVIVGYVVTVLALSVFFIIVGFDIGKPKDAALETQSLEAETVTDSVEPRKAARGERSARPARTA